MSGALSGQQPETVTGAEPLDTSEVRWFAPGSLPSRLISWFSQRPTTIEIREDQYRIDGAPDVGLKRRNRGPLEVKLRSKLGGWIRLPGGPEAQVEDWRKYADVTERSVPSRPPWVWCDVEKVVLTRTYRRLPDGTVALRQPRDLETPGCDIELASVSVGETSAWTFALEAWGPEHQRRTLLRDALAVFFEETPPPPALLDLLDVDAGYPEWLASTALGWQLASGDA